jgi:hypothetical protein
MKAFSSVISTHSLNDGSRQLWADNRKYSPVHPTPACGPLETYLHDLLSEELQPLWQVRIRSLSFINFEMPSPLASSFEMAFVGCSHRYTTELSQLPQKTKAVGCKRVSKTRHITITNFRIPCIKSQHYYYLFVS